MQKFDNMNLTQLLNLVDNNFYQKFEIQANFLTIYILSTINLAIEQEFSTISADFLFMNLMKMNTEFFIQKQILWY